MLARVTSALVVGTLLGGGPLLARVVEIALPAQTVELRPTRDDVTVKALWIQIRCIRAATDAERERTGSPYATCHGFTINGTEITHGHVLDLPTIERNKVRLEPQQIRFSDEDQGHVCIAVRAVFNEVSHREDVELYVNPGDRYSLLSVCTTRHQPAWAANRYVFDQNRVTTPEAFVRRLAAPLRIPLVAPRAR